jgi:phosphonopyruvate decarboxylase
MIKADDFLMPARDAGYDFFTGVPCSFLTEIINRVISDTSLDYVGAASEGEAVAIASGAWLAGRKTVVMCQNSGLGNTVNPITSLNHPFRIPTMMIVTWRGQPGITDEPQHELMGPITPELLDTMRIPHSVFPQSEDEIATALALAQKTIDETDLPFAFIMPKGSVAPEKLDESPRVLPPRGTLTDYSEGGERPTRFQALECHLAHVPETAGVIASTGKSGRELFTLDDRDQHLYQVGSMGCASGMALGVALNSDRKVFALDGDGALLMKMGALATVGAYQPKNMIHVVLDNGVHDSTGGQSTVSASVEFAEIAVSSGYASAAKCDSVAGLEQAYLAALASDGPHLIHMRIQPGSLKELGRPTVKPPEVARRFKAFLAA